MRGVWGAAGYHAPGPGGTGAHHPSPLCRPPLLCSFLGPTLPSSPASECTPTPTERLVPLPAPSAAPPSKPVPSRISGQSPGPLLRTPDPEPRATATHWQGTWSAKWPLTAGPGAGEQGQEAENSWRRHGAACPPRPPPTWAPPPCHSPVMLPPDSTCHSPSGPTAVARQWTAFPLCLSRQETKTETLSSLSKCSPGPRARGPGPGHPVQSLAPGRMHSSHCRRAAPCPCPFLLKMAPRRPLERGQDERLFSRGARARPTETACCLDRRQRAAVTRGCPGIQTPTGQAAGTSRAPDRDRYSTIRSRVHRLLRDRRQRPLRPQRKSCLPPPSEAW